ncbi:MAG: helix-turn-helix transcriptional regulator [Pseudomonadota bacterium]
MDVRSLVAWNLRRLRVMREISQDDLALAAQIERAYVGHLERGNKNPTVLTLSKLAEAMDCEITEFFSPIPKGQEELEPLRAGRKKAGSTN